MTLPGLPVDLRDRYERDGYVVIPSLVSPVATAELRAESERVVEWCLSMSRRAGAPSPRIDVQRAGDGHRLRKIQPLLDISPLFGAVAAWPEVVTPLRVLLDDDAVVFEEKLVLKVPVDVDGALASGADSDEFLFHTDAAYFCLDGYPADALTVAVALDPTPTERGPIEVVPGSHRMVWPVRSEWPPLLPDGTIDEATVEVLDLAPGDVAIFHAGLVHRSGPNRTDQPRRVLLLSFHRAGHDVEPDARNRELRARCRRFEDRWS